MSRQNLIDWFRKVRGKKKELASFQVLSLGNCVTINKMGSKVFSVRVENKSQKSWNEHIINKDALGYPSRNVGN